ncbi:MAG: ATP-dependent DNA helicase RecG [Gammaproteobacteria bacterium]|nr:ATP-dependent DNA helicase RecG [Gammaproteobacteria bacterium]MCW8911630.1 ATP-dependent DNA helicase RecG [Gammaproteobacteria bacterium]MCW9003745.1 ATP-dependent DNA helicase RecG [Gammaproteobacteria bacterium]MCW9055150.1 ATP-dependent DNA helicase RecG [Gammaproteobacteria bacterium]
MTTVASDKIPSVLSFKGVGPRIAEKLEKLGIETLHDVLFYLPFRYEDRTRVVAIGMLRPGMSAVVEGIIEYTQIAFTRQGRSRRMLLCHLSDGTGSILLRFFHFNKQQQNRLEKGIRVRCFGDVRFGSASKEMIHPETQVIDGRLSEMEDSLTPVYPSAEGVHQTLLRKITAQAIDYLDEEDCLQELLPDNILDKYQMPLLSSAIRYIHRPPADADQKKLSEGRQRLAFEELLAQHLSLMSVRKQISKCNSFVLKSENDLIDEFIRRLPYHLTNAQLNVIKTIISDLDGSSPMMRLVQGDVGSGKTVVAAVACLKAIQAGYQSALMAPTEILGEQHYQNFISWFEPLGINVVWLSGKTKGKSREQVLNLIESGQATMIIGTHALFQKDVNFKNLAIAVIDEQHRFGVHQRLALREKGMNNIPHQLIMTATPIPRSLAMTAYADLDYSVIDELPSGRKVIKTVIISDDKRPEVIESVRKSSKKGNQIYWVCTLIEESEAIQCQAAEDTAVLLEELLPELKVALVHGRMNANDKQAIMQSFKEGEIDLLVATTVIEVGVDVPNATLMIIENAERLGLAQLHQLRGRVGRGSEASHCLLMYKKPLGKQAKQRLSIMREYNSGFDIAKKDLELRGPGEVLGTRQTGEMEFRIADILRDEYMIDDVKEVATEMLNKHSDRIHLLIRRWLGKSDRYGEVG